MPRSSAQSDFVFTAAPPQDEDNEVALPETAKVVGLPKAIWKTRFASKRATFWVYLFVGVTLFLLLVLTLVGPHIPSGE